MWQKKVFISNSLLQENAKRLVCSENERTPINEWILIPFSNRWLAKFKKQNEFRIYCSYEEVDDANTAAIYREMPTIKYELQHYSVNDIFSVYEFGVFYVIAPTKTVRQARLCEKKIKATNEVSAVL